MKHVGSALRGHPIAVVAERTGLSQDVLRVWERRYGAVTPARSRGGKRFYSDADVERLTMLRAATRAGRAIGEIALLPTPALATLVADDASARARQRGDDAALPLHDVIAESLGYARALDGGRLRDVLRRALDRMGIAAFGTSVAIPLLHQVGDEWEQRLLTPAHEHLLSVILGDLMMDVIHSSSPATVRGRVIVATPAREHHAIGAAIAGALAVVSGWHVTFLGADLPAADIAEAARSGRAQVVTLSIVHVPDHEHLLGEVRTLRGQLGAEVRIAVGGAAAQRLQADLTAAGVDVFGDFSAWLRVLQQPAATASDAR
jgi:MerR family transcriptional regulator, light-induced transcriptional regulator